MAYIDPKEDIPVIEKLSPVQIQYRKRKEQGLCVTCDNMAEEGKASCTNHLKIKSKYSKARTNRRKADGFCSWGSCQSSPAEGKTLCDPHLADMRERAKARNKDRRAKGLCVDCRKPSPYGQARCPDCRETKTGKPPTPVLREIKAKLQEEKQRELKIIKQLRLEFLMKYLDIINSPRTREIALKRFWEEQTLEEISQDYGLTRERIRQIESQAISKLAYMAFCRQETNIPIKKIETYCNWLRNRVESSTHAA